MKLQNSKYFRILFNRPFVEILVELITGLERRMTTNLPFSVRSSESIYVYDRLTRKSHLVASSSSYTYKELKSNKTRVVTQSERFAVSVKKVQVDLFYGNIFTDKKIFLRESSVWSEAFLNHHKCPAPYRVLDVSNDMRKQTILASNSFYHFFIEDLPDLLNILSAEPEIDVIIWSEAPLYVTEALDLLGIKFLMYQRFVSLDSVIFAEKSKSLAPSKFALIELQKSFGKHLTLVGAGNLQVYISRLNDSRSPKYEAELVKLLERSGKWVVIELSNMALCEQIEFARSAKVWAGVHGAGLSWISMVNEGSLAIEIGPNISDCYEQLAFLAGVKFSRISAEDEFTCSAEFVFEQINRILDQQNDGNGEMG